MTDPLWGPPELTHPPYFPPGEIWIMGAGHFGQLAAERLRRRYPRAPMLVVDRQAGKLERIAGEAGTETREADAVSFLSQNNLSDFLWIIPAVPVHLAFEWFLAQINDLGTASRIPVPEAVDLQVPNPYRVAGGTVYASFATFLCPDVCNEPDELCTYTGKTRPGNLFEVLNRVQVEGVHVTVVRSLQLAPGVGGYTAGYLRKVLEEIKTKPGAHLVATSCRCHGVIDGLQWA